MSIQATLGASPALLDGSADAETRLLLTHGAGGGIEGKGLQSLCEELGELGIFCIRFEMEYRAQGRKTPPLAERSVPGFSRIFETAVSEFGDGRWVVGGRSYGGRVASLAVAGGLPASALLFLAYPLHAPGRKDLLRTDHWPKIQVPTLFIQGTSDPFCDLDLLEASLFSLGGQPTVEVITGADHSLKVPAGRSPEGRARSERSVGNDLAGTVSRWLTTI